MKRNDTHPELPKLTLENESMWVQVPGDFAEKARAFGCDPQMLVWDLAEDFCARNPSDLMVIEKRVTTGVTLPPGVIPFPGTFRAA